MRAKTSSSAMSSPQQAAGNALVPWNFMSEFGRQQLALAAQTASTLYRSRESLRKVQQDASHQASVRHAEAAQKLFGPCQPADVLAIQAELVRNQMQSASQYWQQLTSVALQTQREMMSSMKHMLDSENDGVKSAMETFQASIAPKATSFFASGPEASTEPH